MPPDIRALDIVGRLNFSEVLAELTCHDIDRRRRAAYQLAQLLEDQEGRPARRHARPVAVSLLNDSDPIVRWHGVCVVGRHGLNHIEMLLRELYATETDPWARRELNDYISERPTAEVG